MLKYCLENSTERKIIGTILCYNNSRIIHVAIMEYCTTAKVEHMHQQERNGEKLMP